MILLYGFGYVYIKQNMNELPFKVIYTVFSISCIIIIILYFYLLPYKWFRRVLSFLYTILVILILIGSKFDENDFPLESIEQNDINKLNYNLKNQLLSYQYRFSSATIYKAMPETIPVSQIKQHGLFSKRLVAALNGRLYNKMENDCELDNDEKSLTKEYRIAYQIKEDNPDIFYRVYYHLLQEMIEMKPNGGPLNSLIQAYNKTDCSWESYFIALDRDKEYSPSSQNLFKLHPNRNSFSSDIIEVKNRYPYEYAGVLWVNPKNYRIIILSERKYRNYY